VKRAVVVIALAAAPLLADDVYLRGGGQITGEIVDRSADSVTVDVGGGTLTVRMASVVRIEESVSPLAEYRARAARIPDGDAEAWRELARWATAGAMATMASEAWSKVAAVLPDDPEANRALGRVQYNGRWVTEEESFRAQGYVKFEGEWMTPGERQAILQERRAQEDASRREQEAHMAASEQAKRDRDAQWEAEHEFWHDTPTQYGDATYWPWGSGVVYWPTVPVQQPRPGGPANLPGQGPR
jgi:hypothetical protein